jgi:hypothetical protein
MITRTEALLALAKELSRSGSVSLMADDIVKGIKVGKEGKQLLAGAFLRLKVAAYAVIDTQYEDVRDE